VDETHVLGMLVSGVYGYLLKSEPVAVILEAARAVARGELRSSPEQFTNHYEFVQKIKAPLEELL
jgi:DNA-binding NarL/FixJ family response regulator